MKTQQIINVGSAPNDGQGDPIRTAFIKTKENFANLWALPNPNVPSAPFYGSNTDTPGMYAYDPEFFYYCFATYTGNSVIWAKVPQVDSIGLNTISNGLSNVAIGSANANVTVGVNNNANVAVFTASGVSVAGNITVGNIKTNNYLYANGVPFTSYANSNVANYLPVYSGNIAGGNLAVTGVMLSNSFICATGNVRGGNLNTNGNITATFGWVKAGNGITANGNIYTSQYFIGNFQGNVTGNVTVAGSNTQVLFNNNGNIGAAAGLTYNSGSNTLGVLGSINATTGNINGGNIIATNYVYGNGVNLTGMYGNTNVATYLSTYTGNISANTLNVTDHIDTANISVTGDIHTVNLNASGNLSAPTAPSGTNTTQVATTAFVAEAITSAGGYGNADAAGYLASGNINTNIITSANIQGNYILANVALASGLPAASNLAAYTGNVGCTNINNAGTSGTGNIGNVTKPFNTIFATATSAQYADLAENYTADAEYTPGTVVSFGGSKEVTVSTQDLDVTVAGVISTNPAYHMNTGLSGEYVAAVALQGRAPCRVTGSVTKGAMMVSNGDGTARAESNPVIGSVLGKALESFTGESGTIEVVVGRL